MDGTGSERFEVRGARWMAAFVTITFSVLAVLMAVFATNISSELKYAVGLWSWNMIIFVIITAAFAGLWLQRRLSFVIDDQGITDHGFYFSQGFGLIGWQNIEGIIPLFNPRFGLVLWVKVNNYNELVSRRNPLMQPLLSLSGRLNGFAIYLPIGWSDTDVETVGQQISRYSKNKIQMPSQKSFQALHAALSLIYIYVILSLIVTSMFAAYFLWQHMRNPSLDILGDDGRYVKMKIQTGKQVWLQDYVIRNFGQETTGLQVEISGQAFDSSLLKNPQVLIEFEDKSQVGLPYLAKKTREILPLVPVKKVFTQTRWVGLSKRAFLAHKDGTLLEPSQLFSGKFSQPIAWWTNLFDPCLTIELFADVPKEGEGNMSLKVIPIAYPDNAVSMLTWVATTAEKFNGALLSVAVPKDFPVTTYPDSQIIWLSRGEVRLDSAATPGAIAAYYKEELNRKGWKTAVRDDQADRNLIIEANKGRDRIVIKMAEIEHHTPIEILLLDKRQ